MTKKKVAAIIIIGIMLVASVVILCVTMAHEKGDVEGKSDVIIKINDLQQQRVELYSKIELLEEQRGKTDTAAAAVFFCFDYADRNLYEVIYPTMTYHGCRGIFTFRPGTAPGDEGVITVEQYKELLGADWEAAIKFSGEVDIWETKARFEELGVTFPEIMVFDKGEYSSGLAENLTAAGITVCFCYSEDEDGMMKIPIEPIMYNQSVVKLRTNRAINDGKPLVVRTGHVKRYVDDRSKDCDLEKYEEMLRWMKIMQNKRQLRLQNTYDRSSVDDILNETAVKQEKTRSEIARLNEEIAKIDEEISKLKSSVE